MPIIPALRWSDVDPATHAYDETRLRAVVARAVAPFDLSEESHAKDPYNRQRAEDAIDRALLAELGLWSAGWCWGAHFNGGPNRAYCCGPHSLTSRAEAPEIVVSALASWHGRLEQLSERFEALGQPDLEIDEAACRAAADLLPRVLEWTRAIDAWYATFQKILSWALENQGHEPDEADALASASIDGRFSSWVKPSPDERQAAWGALREATQRVAGPVPDGLAQWRKQRSGTDWSAMVRRSAWLPGTVTRDGHERYIERVDRPRDPARADRMLVALTTVRAAAARGEPLTFEALCGWQEIVLGEPVWGFRKGEAYAHGGRERYGLDPGTQKRFERCLSQTDDQSIAAVSRAARVYLDVCFFHPFADGNARSARLALDYVLTRHGLALHAAEPVFLVARRASDSRGASLLQWVIDYLAGHAP